MIPELIATFLHCDVCQGTGRGRVHVDEMLATDEVRLNTVEGDYREPIRTVHGCVTTEPQGIHPDFKRVLAPPPGQQEWSNKDYTNPLKGHRDPRTETFNDVNGDPRVTTDLTKTLPTDFLSSMPGKMRTLERRAQSVESGVRGRNRAADRARPAVAHHQ